MSQTKPTFKVLNALLEVIIVFSMQAAKCCLLFFEFTVCFVVFSFIVLSVACIISKCREIRTYYAVYYQRIVENGMCWVFKNIADWKTFQLAISHKQKARGVHYYRSGPFAYALLPGGYADTWCFRTNPLQDGRYSLSHVARYSVRLSHISFIFHFETLNCIICDK